MQDAIILYENGKAIGGEGHPTNASDITFDNAGTDLVSEEVESAIKEVNNRTKHGVFEIWTNPNPHTAFAGQNIDIPKDGKTYDGFFLLFSDFYNTCMQVTWGVVGDSSNANFLQIMSNGKIRQFIRVIPITDGGTYYRFAVPDCSLSTVNTYGSAPTVTTDNNELIPAIILGLIHND